MIKSLKSVSFSFGMILLVLSLVFVFPFSTEGAVDNDQLKKNLEDQIKQKEQEIAAYQENIENNQAKASTLKNEIQILEDQISGIQAEIDQIDLIIQKSSLNINEIDGQIGDLRSEMDKKKDLLAEYIRLIAQYDQESLLEVILKNDKFSDFFNEINAIESAQNEIHTVLAAIQGIKDELEEKRIKIEEELAEQNILKSVQLVERRSVEGVQWQKENLLDKTKGQEAAYQQMIQGAEKEIAYIKEQLTLLEKYNLTLEEAVSDAIYVASKTGIRPAFLLGVLEMESRLGINVGTGNWKDDMYDCYYELGRYYGNSSYYSRAEKEKTAFFSITQELGLNPDSQPVSAEPYYGCGGAMGIAQFMPTTWMAYKDRIASLTGNNPPSPWRPLDAFMAAGIKLTDAGANQRTEYAERKAYSIYLAGSRYEKWIYSSTLNKVIQYSNSFQEQYFD